MTGVRAPLDKGVFTRLSVASPTGAPTTASASLGIPTRLEEDSDGPARRTEPRNLVVLVAGARGVVGLDTGDPGKGGVAPPDRCGDDAPDLCPDL